ncbi:hypothetical protein GQ53DRAFT_680615, partial [Thozetella sp. PMI_491]
MRTTLRRSCDACAKAKHRCDLATPRCSRCAKKNASCVYANAPLTSATSPPPPAAIASGPDTPPASRPGPVRLLDPVNAVFDPFDSYPATRLPRALVQRLIHHFLSDIAFQYYPLDLSSVTNPFVISWWPRALEDPALFHVSLQTASLDDELRSQNGFPISELLMADSVSLVRRKIEDASSAFQDETLNSVVTLAAIEHGKGNVQTSRMHIEGIKRIVDVRGGIDTLKRSSPLTARMVSWVSMLVTGAPQFQTQDDFGVGDGITTIPQWQLASTEQDPLRGALDDLQVDPAVCDILARLRAIFHPPRLSQLTIAELDDLTCFAVHRLLLLPPPATDDADQFASSECLRYALALYMLIVHGTTYYSHAALASDLTVQLKRHLSAMARTNDLQDSLGTWAISVGMVATIDAANYQWFIGQAQARMAAATLGLRTWEDVLGRLESIFWMRTEHGELFRKTWSDVLD